MEELMPELVGLVLSQVDPLSLVACRFVCTTWMMRAAPTSSARQEYSKRFAAKGWLGVLRWARANGCLWDKETCVKAARGGHLLWLLLQRLQLLILAAFPAARANGCPWAESTCAWAAEGGHLEVLQWARSNGCPWDAWTCAYAADVGHLSVLQWAQANGCPS